MAWAISDTTTKNSMLTVVNNALGTAAKMSWQNAGSTELATTALNASGVPFSTPASGLMALVGVPLTSTVFSGASCTKVNLQTSGSTNIVTGVVAAVSGGDVNCDAIPVAGQQLRIDSLSLGVT